MRSVLAVLGIAIAAPLVAQPASQPDPAADPTPVDEVLAQSCSAHKFETKVQFTAANGERKQSNVRMCGTVGQTDAQWANTLRDAARKVRSNDSMPEEAKQQVIAAITAEVAKLDGPSAAIAPVTAFTLPKSPPSEKAPSGAEGLAGYSSFPPLPPPVAASPSTPVADSAQSSGTTVPAASATSVATPLLPLIPPPRLTILCGLTTDLRDPGPCSTLERTSVLQVRADENLPAGFELRFVRKGTIRGSINLAAMRHGQTVMLRTPSKLCAGVLRTTAQIEIVKAGAVVDKRGPFDLRC
jgi:hypothetical protein